MIIPIGYAKLSDYETVINSHFDGFTMFRAEGCWQSTREASIVFEVVTDVPIKHLYRVAEDLKQAGDQENVYMTLAEVDLRLFTV